MSVTKIRVMLVEDNKREADLLARLISKADDMQVCAICETAEEAPVAAELHQPDVAIIDQKLPKLSGVECIKQILELSTETRCLMLTTEDDPNVLFSAICAGAVGHLVKVRDTARIVDAIRDTAKGESVITPSLASKLVEHFRATGCGDEILGLTKREAEILELSRKQLANKTIANALNISVSTVKQHIHAIYRKAWIAKGQRYVEELKRARGRG